MKSWRQICSARGVEIGGRKDHNDDVNACGVTVKSAGWMAFVSIVAIRIDQRKVSHDA